MRDLIRKVLLSDSDIRIMYNREILEYIDENNVINLVSTNQNSEIFLDDIELEDVYFFELEQVQFPDEIKDYIKLIDKIKKSNVEKDNPEYIIDNRGLEFLSEEYLNDFYSLDYIIDYIIDYLYNIELLKVQYLKPEKIKL